MRKSVLVIGGYGGTGKAIVKALLMYDNVNIRIAGRNEQKLKDFQAECRQDFLGCSVEADLLDVRKKSSLLPVMEKVDLVVLAATTPDAVEVLAEAAIATQTDVMDILVRGDVVDRLATYEEAMEAAGIRWITQSGFHPGLIAPIVKLAKDEFDFYWKANVAMAMDPAFTTINSVKEILHEVAHPSSQVLRDGVWRKATYRDTISLPFEVFGRKICYPLQMKEMYGLEHEIGLQESGAYAAGFNWYIDYLIFPVAAVLGRINDNLSEQLCGYLLYREARKFGSTNPRVEMVMKAEGTRDGAPLTVQYSICHHDGYELTALAIVACINQIWTNYLSSPGLHLMGQSVDEKELFRDLQAMSLEIEGYKPPALMISK